jgi:hypothetical protein
MKAQQFHHRRSRSSTKGLLIVAGLVAAILASAVGLLLQEGVGTLFSRMVYLAIGVWYLM